MHPWTATLARGSDSMPEFWRPEIAAILSPDLRECRTRSTGELRRRGRPSVDRQPFFQWLEFDLASYQSPDDDSGQRESGQDCHMKSNQSAVKSNSGVDGLSSSISMAENSPLSVRAFLTLSACSVVTPRQIVMRLLSARTPTTLYIDREIMAAIRSASRAKERCGGLPYNADRRT